MYILLSAMALEDQTACSLQFLHQSFVKTGYPSNRSEYVSVRHYQALCVNWGIAS